MSEHSEASKAQIRAADPTQSTWVSANAGSGKTRVLTDRVARLLLRDVRPERVLCLTYTKAAATHMQNQLFRRLGGWAMLPDDKLRRALQELGEDSDILDADHLSRARRLFASALETPGGLKIQTIHSFCASLLRRFPLEAGVSPNFQEMDERSAKRLRVDVLETLANVPDHAAFDGMARAISGDESDAFCREIISNSAAFQADPSPAEIRSAFGLNAEDSEARYLASVFANWSADLLPRLCAAMSSANISSVNNPEKFRPYLNSQPSAHLAKILEGEFIYKQNAANPFAAKSGKFPVQAARKFDPGLEDALNPVMEDFATFAPLRKALEAAERTEALYAFARLFLREYNAQKAMHGWLDFDDLIEKARGLLTESSMAAWVLYKLDGGIDHILVDEAQDTSPAQWAVVEKLAEEFWAGAGSADTERTLFVVGDEKQSIYSFQGADPLAFERMRGFFDSRLKNINKPLNLEALLYSFRSSPAILALVDVTLTPDQMADTSLKLEHISFHDALPGRVDLWPFIDAQKPPEFPDWRGLDALDVSTHHDTVLAEQIATSIKGVLDRGETLATKDGIRPIKAGDFLVLVQRRKGLFAEIIRCLKAKGLPVAGADRLKISTDLAVQDLVSVLKFLVTPSDDLSLAEALRSPLFELDQQALFTLSYKRPATLWLALEAHKSDFAEAFEILSDLFRHLDFLRPYELLERLLIRHKGRERLIGRLGRESEDAIDALLSQSLAYEQVEPPTLSGFLGWIAEDESELKREMDSESAEIRVMTVHGAKGLEAPIVILPDTSSRNAPRPAKLHPLASGLIGWAGRAEDDPDVFQASKEAAKQLQEQERARLLYVALTRAESWLIVCGAGRRNKDGACWYDQVSVAMSKLETRQVAENGVEFQRFQPLDWPEADTSSEKPTTAGELPIPDWALNKAATPLRPTPALTPSQLGGEKALASGQAPWLEDIAMARGRLLHQLLEHLPQADPADRAEIADFLTSAADDLLDEEHRSDVKARAFALLKTPSLQELFAPSFRREVPLAVDLNGLKVRGILDLLRVSDALIEIVDFKSNATPPGSPDQVPEGILRQMGAYVQAVSQIYPDRPVSSAVLWTKTAELMTLPHDIVTNAWQRATTS